MTRQEIIDMAEGTAFKSFLSRGIPDMTVASEYELDSAYTIGDKVVYEKNVYQCIADVSSSSESTPDQDTDHWKLIGSLASLVSPIRQVTDGDKTYYDLSGGFDPRFAWLDTSYLSQHADPPSKQFWRNIMRTDISSIAAIGIRDTQDKILGRPNTFDETIADTDSGYFGGAEVRREDTNETLIAIGKPTKMEVSPFVENDKFYSKPTKESFTSVQGCNYDLYADTEDFDVSVQNNLPFGDPFTYAMHDGNRELNARIENTVDGKRVLEYGVYKENPKGMPENWNTEAGSEALADYYRKYDTNADSKKMEETVQKALSDLTISGTFNVFEFTPKRDVYGCLIPNLAIATIPEIGMPTTSESECKANALFGAMVSQFPQSVVYKTAKGMGARKIKAEGWITTALTGWYRGYPSWGGRWWISTDEDGDIGVTVFSSHFAKSGDANRDTTAEYASNIKRCAPVMYFRKGVKYYMKVTLENSFLVDPRMTIKEQALHEDRFKAVMSTCGLPVFPIAKDINNSWRRFYESVREDGVRMFLMKYGDAMIPPSPAPQTYPEKTYNEDPFKKQE